VFPRCLRRARCRELRRSDVAADGRAVVEKTQPNIFSADETAAVGIDNQTLVAEGIGVGAESRFTVKINKITLEVSPAKSAQP